MIIDFHTHVFPDKIAQKTIDFLAEKGGSPYYANGTVQGLLTALEKAGASIGVALPVLTKPEQFESVLNYVTALNENFSTQGLKIISFAGIHPKCTDIKGKLLKVKELGFKGVKIHPDYQDTFFDDEGYVEILKCAKELDLIVVTHAGVDVAYKNQEPKCLPSLIKKVIEKVGHNKLVLAHFGSSQMVNEFLDLVAGENVYIDTALVLKHLSFEDFNKVLKKHGEDKILFASDSPWSDIESDVNIVKNFVKDKNVLNKILYQNAEKLLGI